MFTAGLAVIPAAVLILGMFLFIKGHRPSVLFGLLSGFITVAFGLWAINQSRSSTASIGILFLPLYGTIAAALGFSFYFFKAKSKFISYLTLILNITFIATCGLRKSYGEYENFGFYQS